MMTLQWWQFVLIIVGVIIVSAIVTFIVTKKIFERHLKKNPPINENQVRAMLTSMGRTPSEKQVRQVMRSFNDAK